MWSQILGHTKQIEQLKKALAENKIPHAFLFCGIEGIGKKRVALGLAQSLNDTSKINHPDCFLIEPAGEKIKTIRVDVLRDLKQKAYLHPLEGKAKIFIIDQPEKMTLAGANALLKILEEPPSQTYFILITSSSSLLLPTIRSRCQIIEFSPLSEELIAKKLMEEGKNTKEAALLAGLAQGSLEKALTFDPKLFEDIKTKLEGLQKNPTPTNIFSLSETWSDEEERLPFIFDVLSRLFYERIGKDRGEETLSRLTDQWFAIQTAKNKLQTTANKRLLLESLLFTLASLCSHPEQSEGSK